MFQLYSLILHSMSTTVGLHFSDPAKVSDRSRTQEDSILLLIWPKLIEFLLRLL